MKLMLDRYLCRDTFLYVAARNKENEYLLDTVAGTLMGNVQQWLLEHPELPAEEYLRLLHGNFVRPIMRCAAHERLAAG